MRDNDMHKQGGWQSLAGQRIVIVLGYLTLGGAERQAILLARNLVEKYHAHVEIVGFSQPGEAATLCDDLGIPWRFVPFYWPLNRLGKIKNLLRLALVLRHMRPDILLPFTMQPNVACGLVWRWTGARLCIWNQRAGDINRMGQRIEQRATSQFPTFVSNSQHGADFLVRNLGVASEKVSVIHNGIELFPARANRLTWRSRLGLSEDCFVACMVANLHFRKDHVTLLKAWKIVVARLFQMSRTPILVLAGRPQGTEECLKALACDLQVERHVRFLGHVGDISGLLGAVDLGVFSSDSEGSPNGVLECMAAGLAIAATDIPGIREAVGPDGYPFLAFPGDADTMAGKILELALNPELRKKLAIINRRRIDMEFTLEGMCEKMVALMVDAPTRELRLPEALLHIKGVSE
jgi:glycosyltransferase involved in cell wall biosynthesis